MSDFSGRYYERKPGVICGRGATYAERTCPECGAIFKPLSPVQIICAKHECRLARQRRVNARSRAKARKNVES